MTEKEPHHRRIRSFVRREGRFTPGQQRAFDTLWPQYGIEADGSPIDFDAVFGHRAPRIVEIGFGNGESLAAMAASHPENDYLGIEVHRPGVGRLLQQLETEHIANVRVMSEDAVEILERQIPDTSLHGLLLFFPDPWHKKRHHKRRILQPAFVQLVRRKLEPGGFFHMATDWENYAEQMLEVMSAAEGFTNTSPSSDFVPCPDYRPKTKFERRGERLGHGVWDLVFEKID
ncbi:tRNA (guanosine(46)-N7)-methyltransferase TrmB [Thiohalomonas denitrificans]|uniref:tRNA (guanine-N(7)-)-methyltransferase n=1 Tax=Thiohalomonas denitrificans TaxID=415747 RepID=A0A1G5QT66_9GAMM|nr:tRNA (guanosine(46)-N7)-methyltransferase TrmB [Thiohalomonas denitrificans]SCZ64866.1 tRNA (guanine-N(7)-)-methyltransferase [Thiohalomonas denitrificans]